MNVVSGTLKVYIETHDKECSILKRYCPSKLYARLASPKDNARADALTRCLIVFSWNGAEALFKTFTVTTQIREYFERFIQVPGHPTYFFT
jgi:hypothetical protein